MDGQLFEIQKYLLPPNEVFIDTAMDMIQVN